MPGFDRPAQPMVKVSRSSKSAALRDGVFLGANNELVEVAFKVIICHGPGHYFIQCQARFLLVGASRFTASTWR